MEFKFYAIRRPETREKLMEIYGALGASVTHFDTLLFGANHSPAVLRDLKQRLIVLSSLLSGLALEHRLRPGLFAPDDLQALAEEIFDRFFAAHV